MINIPMLAIDWKRECFVQFFTIVKTVEETLSYTHKTPR